METLPGRALAGVSISGYDCQPSKPLASQIFKPAWRDYLAHVLISPFTFLCGVIIT